MYCKNCGAALEDGALVCPSCFTPVTDGAAAPQANGFGGAQTPPRQGDAAPLTGEVPPAGGQQAQGPGPQQPYYQQQPYQQQPYQQQPYQQQPYQQQPYYQQPAANDTAGCWLCGVCFLVPLVGLILYLVWKDQRPLTARAVGKWAIIGFVVNMVFGFLSIVLTITGTMSIY